MLFSAAVVVLSYIYYGSFLHNFFAYDDYGFIENNSLGISRILLGTNVSLRVLGNGIWWPLHLIGGLNPFAYNLFGLALHGVNAILLYLLLLRLFNHRGYALIGGAVFLLNASGCDAVFWKSSNCTLICSFFYIIAVYNYIVYRQDGSRTYLWLSVVSFLFAIFSKEDAASMPFIILLIEFVFFGGMSDKKAAVCRAVPYTAVILFFFLITEAAYRFHGWAGTPVKIRLLYTIFAGWTVFFLHPFGSLELSNPAIYITAIGMVLSLFWVKDKKALFFGYGWIFFSFLPQSISGAGQFEITQFTNSISRYLYLPAIGSSIVWAAIIVRFQEKVSPRVGYSVAAVFLLLFAWLNYGRIQETGEQSKEFTEPMAHFMDSIKKTVPGFPPNSYVYVMPSVLNASRGRIEQLLRLIYQRPDIHWIYSPEKYSRGPGESAFLIICYPRYIGMDLAVYPISKVPMDLL